MSLNLPSSVFQQTRHTSFGPLAALPCCFFAVLGVGLFVFWIWMLIDCLTKEFPGENEKVIWVLVVILLNWVGALVYFFVGRPKGRAAQSHPRD